MHDILIIGAGHNGLTCAYYLAKKGLKVAKEILRRRGVFKTTVCRKPDPDLDVHDLAELDHALALARPDLMAEAVA